MDPQGYPSPPPAPQRLLLLGSRTGVKGAQPSYLPPPLRSYSGISSFLVSSNIKPALLISQRARGEHMRSTLEAHWCCDPCFLLVFWLSIIFVLSVSIEASLSSLSAGLSQLLFPGASSILRLSLQPGADSHPQHMSIMQPVDLMQQRWHLSAYPWALSHWCHLIRPSSVQWLFK